MLITRRGLVRRLLGAAGAAVAGGVPAERRLVLEQFWIAGLRYYRGLALVGALRPGDALALHAEPSNAYDPRAVEIMWRGEKLGYVPRRRNAVIHRLLAQGATLRAHICALQPENEPWEMVEVQVCL